MLALFCAVGLDNGGGVGSTRPQTRVAIVHLSSCWPLQELKQQLLPSPERCLSELNALLPALAAERYEALIAEVHDALDHLEVPLDTAEELAQHLSFLDQLRARRPAMEQNVALVRLS
jgi:hypothetical protein